MLLDRLRKRCEERLVLHQHREPICLSHTTGLLAQESGNKRQSRLFACNNYLGLANHPKMIHAFCEAVQKYGVGSGASPLVTGYSDLHRDAERAYADFVGVESAMLCSSGFAANLSVIQGLVNRSDVVLHDRDNHASLLDATVLSRANLKRYEHLSVDACEKALAKTAGKDTLLVSDSVFSMSGDIAPVSALAKHAKVHNATLLLDDSHGFGVLGEAGRGIVELSGLSPDVLTIGLGKAMGCSGGLILGSHELINGLRQFSRAYVYSTAIPPALAAAAKQSLTLLQEESWRVLELHRLIAYFQEKAKGIGLSCLPSQTAIQSWLVGDEEKATAMAKDLKRLGYLLVAIRTPTVPLGEARLRIALNVGQRDEDIDGLIEAIEKVRDSVG